MPVNITEEFVRFLMKQNEEQSARIAELSAEITSLNQTIRELKEQLNKNSKNSSKPPLSDGLKKTAHLNFVKHKQHQLSLEIMYGLVAGLLFYQELLSEIML